MDASALASAESWLWWISGAKLVAAFLVAVGVAIEFGGDWIARPFEKTVALAREQQLETLRTATATAETRAGEAAQKAEEERIARLKLEALIQPREINPDQRRQIGEILRRFAGHPVKLTSPPIDLEATRLATEIFEALQYGGVAVEDLRNRVMFTSPATGVQIGGPAAELGEDGLMMTIGHALAATGLAVTVITGPLPDGQPVTVGVAAKPIPQ
jgi:hypothetical protein